MYAQFTLELKKKKEKRKKGEKEKEEERKKKEKEKKSTDMKKDTCIYTMDISYIYARVTYACA